MLLVGILSLASPAYALSIVFDYWGAEDYYRLSNPLSGWDSVHVLYKDEAGNTLLNDTFPSDTRAIYFFRNGSVVFTYKDSAGNVIQTYPASLTQNVSWGSDPVWNLDGSSTAPGGTDPDPEPTDPPPTQPDPYIAKLNEILAAIPSPPNWDSVADTFRDSIAPQMKSDLQQVLGTAPAAPSAPSSPAIPTTQAPTAPAAPPSLGGIDDGGLTAPTGQEDPGLGDAGFSSGDIKSEAPAIPERTDPNDGFSIMDPVGSLPDPADWEQNAPVQESNPAPMPATPQAPAPEGPPMPSAPAPEEPPATDTGGSDYSTPPMPGGTSGTMPAPGTGTGSGDFGIPVPGDSNEVAP